MFKSIPLISNQKDLIHDISFNFYGTRMATASNDHSINVWDMNEKGDWFCSSSWKAHNGPVWKVIWAHPEFGQVLASCSFDRTVAIWEEMTQTAPRPYSASKLASNQNWCKRASLVDSRASVTGIAFAPHAGLNAFLDLSTGPGRINQPGPDLGLTLVAGSADGMVRFYEAPDVVNLSQWSLSYEMMAQCGLKDIDKSSLQNKDPTGSKAISTAVELSLSWSPSRVFLPLLAVGIDGSHDAQCDYRGKVQIYQCNDNGKKWVLIEDQLGSISDPIKDIKFAPDIGLGYHVLACATPNIAYIYALKPSDRTLNGSAANDDSLLNFKSFLETSAKVVSTSAPDFTLYQMAQLLAQGHSIWRLSWNLTGNVLATSGQDGMVRLWKANFLGQWKCSIALKNDGMIVNGSIPSTTQNAIEPEKPFYKFPTYEPSSISLDKPKSLAKFYGKSASNVDSPSQVVWH